MSDLPVGVQYQVYLFQRDYRNGLAISDRYLALINSPEYLQAGSRDKQKTQISSASAVVNKKPAARRK
jgi:hypothetical protein